MQLRIIQAFNQLGLAESASLTEVKKHYRLLAKKYHPDAPSAEASEERFIEITNAYNLLVDYYANPDRYSVYSSLVEEGDVSPDPTKERWKQRFTSKEEWMEHLRLAKIQAEKRKETILHAQKKAYLRTQKRSFKIVHGVFSGIAVLLLLLLLADYWSPYKKVEVRIDDQIVQYTEYNFPTIDFTIRYDGRLEHVVIDQQIIYSSLLQMSNKLERMGILSHTKYLHIPKKLALKVGPNSTPDFPVYESSDIGKVPAICILLSFCLIIYIYRPKDYTGFVFLFYTTWGVSGIGFLSLLMNGLGLRIVYFILGEY